MVGCVNEHLTKVLVVGLAKLVLNNYLRLPTPDDDVCAEGTRLYLGADIALYGNLNLVRENRKVLLPRKPGGEITRFVGPVVPQVNSSQLSQIRNICTFRGNSRTSLVQVDLGLHGFSASLSP
jgi:hypothetical protein